MKHELLVPEPDAFSEPFWAGCAAGHLRLQKCRQCDAWRFPPRPVCPSCRSFAVDWVPVSGLGTIWSFVVAHPPLLTSYAELAPYPVVVVGLAEDPALRMVGNLVAEPGAPINSVDPATLTIGQPVRVTFEAVSDALALPRWVPVPVG